MQIGPAPITVSGMVLHALTMDEATVLTGYRMVRDQGSGSLIVEFVDQRVTKWDVRPNIGSARVLNEMMGAGKSEG